MSVSTEDFQDMLQDPLDEFGNADRLLAFTLGVKAVSVSDADILGRERVFVSAFEAGRVSFEEVVLWAHRRAFLRCRALLWGASGPLPSFCDRDALDLLCVTAISRTMAQDKQARWLGYVQGVLFAAGVLDVRKERDVTRPWFHLPFKVSGAPLPETPLP